MDVKKVFLNLGELYVSKEPCVIHTLLGSCVSVALWDRRLNVGGMCHFVVAKYPKGKEKTNFYGDIALKNLLNEMLLKNVKIPEMGAKIYGGANIYKEFSSGKKVGEDNIAVAEEFLKEKKIPVIHRDIGGNDPREILFDTKTFDIICTKSVGMS